MKSVLLHVQDDPGLEARLQAALSIVRASGGHLSCRHITPINNYVASDGLGGAFVISDVIRVLGETEKRLRAEMAERLAKEDVPWDYAHIDADPASQLVSEGALNDVIVLSREPHSQTSAYPALMLFGDVLQASRTPILVQPGQQHNYDPLGPAVIAWNGSFEAANALRQALPLLRFASAVHVVSIEEPEEDRFPSTSASEYLSRHGIASELHSHGAQGRSIAENIIEMAQVQKAATVVMGAYGHSRAREYLFGGVTRSMLKDCPLPLLLGR